MYIQKDVDKHCSYTHAFEDFELRKVVKPLAETYIRTKTSSRDLMHRRSQATGETHIRTKPSSRDLMQRKEIKHRALGSWTLYSWTDKVY